MEFGWLLGVEDIVMLWTYWYVCVFGKGWNDWVKGFMDSGVVCVNVRLNKQL